MDINKVELFLMDMDGTVYVGKNKIEGAFEALETLKSKGKKICFLTNNSSRSNATYRKMLADMQVFVTKEELYTSAEATISYLLSKQQGKKVFLVANADVTQEFIEQGVTVTDQNPDIVVVTFDTSLTYEKLFMATTFIDKGAMYIATHPDNFCPHPVSNMPDVGGFIAIIEKTINKLPDLIIGKPYQTIGDCIKNKFGLASDQIAMVGDRLYTDIKFGENNGFYSVLVFTGETTKEQYAGSEIRATLAVDTFKDVLKYIS